MVDFTTPNLCGANTDFNSLISKFVDIEKILTDNLNVDASALSGLVSPELTDLLTKVRELAPAAPTLPNISLQSQIGDLLDIDKSKILDSGYKGFFTKKIDDLLLRKKIDLAIHSAKDIPSRIDNNISIAAFLKREDPRDILLSKKKLYIQ